MAKKHTVTILEGDKEIPANFWIEPWGFVTRTGLQPQKEYRWEELTEFSIEGPEQLQKRVTVTRLVAIGIFAFAKKKASGESFLFAKTKAGKELIVKFHKKSEPEVAALFAPYRGKLPSQGTPTPNSGSDLADQISRLADLHAKGVLSEEEFREMKSKLLDS
jgi:hypothetical protein